MSCYVGLDASKRHTSICVVDKTGRMLKEGLVETTPAAIANFLRGDRLRYSRVGLETWTLAPWLYEGLARRGLPVICINATHAHNVLKTQPNKTDKADARGIAELMRIGSYRTVHVKTVESQRIQIVLTARRLLKAKQVAIQNAIGGLLLGLGLKLERGRKTTFEERVRKLARKDATANCVLEPLLEVRALITAKIEEIDVSIRETAESDPVCQVLMTAPGIGALGALAFKSAIDVPSRFPNSRSIGPHLGLVPRTHQSGETERRGRISRRGDSEVRRMLYLAALTVLRRDMKTSWLKRWGEQIVARRGSKQAAVAVARRLSIVLHRMWVTQTPFRWELTA